MATDIFDRYIPDKRTFDNISENIARIALEMSGDQTGAVFPAMLNEQNYVPTMRKWFQANWVNGMSDLTALCEKWYTITRTGWRGGVTFSKSSSLSTGTKTGDNAGKSCTPSTIATKGQDDYQNIPLFVPADCNVYLDSDGNPRITAIADVFGEFKRTDPAKIVGVLQMTGWARYFEDAESYGYEYTDVMPKDGFYPLPEAVALDGTVRPFVVHGKYAFGDAWECCSGRKTRLWDVSHNSQRTGVWNKWGSRYCGRTSADDAFLKLMAFLKYGSLTMDNIMAGCLNYNYQYPAAVEETGVERILITTGQAANLIVGSSVLIGNPTAYSSGAVNIDRDQTGMRAKADRVRITKIENVTIDGATYAAVYVDNGGVTFDTTANTIQTEGDAKTYITTIAWGAGACDEVQGVDGSPTSCTSGKEPYKLQGIELGVGAYMVYGDAILQYFKEDGVQKMHVCVCRDASKIATSVTADYRAAGYSIECPSANNWVYIKYLGHDEDLPELIFPKESGGSSATYTRDAIYLLADSTGVYEGLAFCPLSYGVEPGGLSAVYGRVALGVAWWHISGGLSLTGNRGEYAA